MRLSLALSTVLVLASTQLAAADHCFEPAPTAGAIAYSPSTGSVAWAWGQPDQEAARRAAELACGQEDCGWKVSEQGAFAALVLGAGGTFYWAWDQTLAGAEQHALELCSAQSTGCSVASWVAS